MIVKVLINDSERIEFNKCKSENANLKCQVQVLKDAVNTLVNTLADVINNNDSRDSDATIRSLKKIKKAVKNIGRRRSLRTRKKSKTSKKAQTSNDGMPPSSSSSYGQSGISSIRSIPSSETISSPFYFSAKSSQSPIESQGLSFHDAVLCNHDDVAMLDVGKPNDEQNVSNTNIGAKMSDQSHFELMTDDEAHKSFYQSGVSNLQESYQSVAENHEYATHNPQTFSNKQSTPYYESMSNGSELIFSTIPHSPISSAGIWNSLNGCESVSQMRESNQNSLRYDISFSSQSIFDCHTIPETVSYTSQAEVMDSSNEVPDFGTPIASFSDEKNLSSLYRSGVSQSQNESLAAVHNSKRNASHDKSSLLFESFEISICSTSPDTRAESSHLSNEDEPAAKIRRLSLTSPNVSNGRRKISHSTRPSNDARPSPTEDQTNATNVGSTENSSPVSVVRSPNHENMFDLADEWSNNSSSLDECAATSYKNVFNTPFMQVAVGHFAHANEMGFSISEYLTSDLRKDESINCLCCLCELRETFDGDFRFCVKQHPNLLHCKKSESETKTVCNPCMASMTKNSEKVQNEMYRCCFDSCSKEFGTLKTLESHYFEHLNLSRFKCSICSKGFGSKSSLRLHERSHL